MGRRRKFIVLANVSLLWLGLTFSCSPQESIFEQLNVADFQKVIENKNDILILDVRTPEEYQNGYLNQAEFLNFYDPDFKNSLNELEKSQAVAVYCAVGARSYQAMELMKTLGFKEVYHLEGGLVQWQREGKPLVQ